MADQPRTPAKGSPPVVVTAADDQRAVVALNGVLDVDMARAVEEHFVDPRLRQAREWVLDMSGLTRLSLACAYAVLRAATRRPETAKLTIRGARRNVQRTLHHAGVDAVAAIEE